MDKENDYICKLENEVEDLRSKLLDLSFQINYSKEIELLEFLRELYQSLKVVDDKLTKEDIVKNLKEYIEKFAEYNKLML